MEGIFDSLFSVLPIVLAILWLVRRTTKSADKRKRRGPATQDSVPPVRGIRSRSARNMDNQPIQKPAKKFGSKAAKAIEKFLGESFSPPQGESPRGEDELYERMDSHRIEVKKPAVPQVVAVESTHRTLMSTESQDYSTNTSQHASTLERISKLPPLAQGMIWSFILNEPPGMKLPDSD